MFTARLGKSVLEHKWHSFAGGTGDDWATAVLVDNDNNYYLAGYSQWNWRHKEWWYNGKLVDPVAEHTVPVPDYDFVVVKTTSKYPYHRWHTFRGGQSSEDVPHAMALSGDGNTVYVVGEARGLWKTYGDGDPLHGFSGDAGITDMAILGLDVESGKSRWHTFRGGLGADRAYSVATDMQTGDIIVGGTSDVAWRGDDEEKPKYTFPNGTAGGLNPNFSILRLRNYVFVVTASVQGGHGAITPAGKTLVRAGADQEFTFTPDPGYKVARVILNGTEQAWSTNIYKISKVAEDCDIKVVFRKLYLYAITPSAGKGGTIDSDVQRTVSEDGDIAFTTTASTGYVIDTLKVVKGTTNETITAASGRVSYVYTFTNVQANGSITVTFKTKTYTITPSAGKGGTISPDTAQTVGRGASKTLDVLAGEGYRIASVRVCENGSVQDIDGLAGQTSYTYTFRNVQADGSITATFKKPQDYTITVRAGENGTIGPGTSQIERGTSRTFTITSANGYGIDTMVVDGNTVAGASGRTTYTYTFAKASADHTITATFEAQSVFTIKTWLSAGGSISPRDNITVAKGASQSYTITADTGYVINTLRVVEDGTSEAIITEASGQTSYTYTFTNAQADGSITVTFKQKPATTYTIDASAGANGTISPAGSVSVTSGGSQTFTIAASDGYEVENVIVDNVSKGATTTYTFTNVTGNHTITVTFKQKPATTYTIDASAGANGTISPDGATEVDAHGSQTFTIFPDQNYVIDAVWVDGQNAATVFADAQKKVNAILKE